LQADYDEASDTLFLCSQKEKAANSIAIGNVAVDYSKKGEVVGLEFLDASKTIPPLLLACPKQLLERQTSLKKQALAGISRATVSVSTAASFAVIAFTLNFGQEPAQGKLVLPMPSPAQMAIARQTA